MSGVSLFGSPLLLGFQRLEDRLDRAAKMASDGYPPYNIEQIGDDRIQIVLAVAGFAKSDLTIEKVADQLTVSGRQPSPTDDKVFLHRGIAARHFQRSFMLADGLKVEAASLDNGLLAINLALPPKNDTIETIEIN